jgi:hypothetical protein
MKKEIIFVLGGILVSSFMTLSIVFLALGTLKTMQFILEGNSLNNLQTLIILLLLGGALFLARASDAIRHNLTDNFREELGVLRDSCLVRYTRFLVFMFILTLLMAELSTFLINHFNL